jgi:hypothetical protein
LFFYAGSSPERSNANPEFPLLRAGGIVYTAQPTARYGVRTLVVGLKATRITAQLSLSFSKNRDWDLLEIREGGFDRLRSGARIDETRA